MNSSVDLLLAWFTVQVELAHFFQKTGLYLPFSFLRNLANCLKCAVFLKPVRYLSVHIYVDRMKWGPLA